MPLVIFFLMSCCISFFFFSCHCGLLCVFELGLHHSRSRSTSQSCLGLVLRYYWPCEMSWRVFPLIFIHQGCLLGFLCRIFLLLITSFTHLGLSICSFLLESVMVICTFLQICPLHLSCLI